MARWAAFVGLTGFLLLSMLALARLSRQAMSDGEGALDGGAFADESRAGRPNRNPATTDPRLPRFESVHRHAMRTEARSDPTVEMSTGALLLNVALTQGLFGAIVAGAAIYFEIPARAFGLGSDGLALDLLAIGIGFGVVLWIVTEAVGSVADAAGVGYDETLRGMLAPNSTGGWALLLGVILPTVAIVEEFLFRGAAIGAVVAGFGTPVWAAALVSSLAFGAAHGAQGKVGMALATALGLTLAGVFVATGSLLVVIVAHYLVNALEFTLHEGLDVEPPSLALSR